MSLKIAINSADDQGERIIVHAGHREDQANYQPTQIGTYDEDVEHMSVSNFSE